MSEHCYSLISLPIYLQDPNILPIFAEITGGPPSSGNIATAPRSRPSSGPPPIAALTIAKVPSSPHCQVRRSSPDTLEGLFLTKQTGAGVFARCIWRERRVTLNQNSLIVRVCYHISALYLCFILFQASGMTRNIPLASLTSIEPDSKQQNCLVIQYSASTFRILFRDDSELYTWLDALYLRSSLSTPIGMPTNVVHRVHVGFNAMTGGFTVGLDSSISHSLIMSSLGFTG